MLISKLSRNAARMPLQSSVFCVGDFRVDPALAPRPRVSAPHVDVGSAQHPQVIETAPAKSGAAVQPVTGSRPAIVATVVAVLVLVAGTSLYVYVPRGGERAAGTPPAIHSLVVLPLENLSGEKEQEYFADGMTDALITNLAQIGSLRIISRTSAMQLKGSKQTLQQIWTHHPASSNEKN